VRRNIELIPPFLTSILGSALPVPQTFNIQSLFNFPLKLSFSHDKRISKVVQAPGFIRGINPKSKIENPQAPAFIRGVASKI